MSSSHDIYDPPPAPVAYSPPQSEPLRFTRGDLAYLVILCGLLTLGTIRAWRFDSMLGLGVLVGGLFVIFESWFSALMFLHRHPADRALGRWMIFLAALAPWIAGLGFTAALILGLFALSDWAG